MTEEEILDGARTNPAGVPGARSNLPGNDGKTGVGFRQNVKKELKTMNYAVPKTTKRIKQSAGAINKISVAVLVDGETITEKNEKGEMVEKWQPRTPEELAKYENIIRNTIGFDKSRGDSVKIENIKFDRPIIYEEKNLLN